MAAPKLSGGDLRVAVGLASFALTTDLIVTLCEKNLLSEDDALKIYTGAIAGLGVMGAPQPHPGWVGAQNLLKMHASKFGGPRPGSKPS